MFRQWGLKQRVVACLLLFGMLPALSLYGFFLFFSRSIENDYQKPLLNQAENIIESIDRTLEERNGDVQSFTLNAIVRDQNNWQGQNQTYLVNLISDYIKLYNIYDAMMILDQNGVVRAMNTKGVSGKPLKTSYVGTSFEKEDWFQKALKGDFIKTKNGEPLGAYIQNPKGSPLLDKLYGRQDAYAMVFSAPIKDYQGRTIGVWANFSDVSFLDTIFKTYHKRNIENGNAHVDMTILDKTGVLILEYDADKTDAENRKRDLKVFSKRNLAKKGIEAAVAVVAGKTGLMTTNNKRKNIKQIAGYTASQGVDNFPGLGWGLMVRSRPSDVYASLNNMGYSMMFSIGLALFLISLASWLIGKHFSNIFMSLSSIMRRIASGQKGLEVPYQEDKTEIGQMAQSCQFFKEVIIKAEKLTEDQKNQAEYAQKMIKQKMLMLTDEIEKEMQETISQVIENTQGVLKISQEMRVSAQRVSGESQAVSQATERAQMNVESVAAATEELSISVNEISQQVSHAAITAQSAVASANITNETVQQLADAVKNVGDVVLLISDIAEQTNLLALNATIEAARAGDSGKGFSVVAAEVKNLANQTTKATDGITSQITAIQRATQNSVSAIENIVKTIQEIDNISSSIAAAVEEQGAATNEISANTQQAAQGTRSVSEKIVGVNKEFQNTNELSSQVQTMTSDVMERVQGLRLRMVEILRNSYAGDRRVNVRYKTQNYTALANVGGKSYPCDVKDISCDGIAFFSKDLGKVVDQGAALDVELSGYTQKLNGKVCGVMNGEVVRVMFVSDEKQRQSIERFLKARFENKAEKATVA